ncbi:MAG: iron ABC transporter permease [Deltaproteobacteria bacterium]|nr:iron ABC transporter permease [Deltaproteobacteria bacterium]
MYSNRAMRVVFAILMVIIGFTVFLPVCALIFGSFWSDSPVAPTGHLTLANWVRALSMSIPATLPGLFLNSLLFAFLVATISVTLGVIMAYLVERTDMPFGHFFEQLAILPRSFPVIIAALAWIMLLSPRIGVLNLLFRELFGFPLFNVYSFPGMVFLMVLYESPIVFLMALNAFRLMDPSLEEQSLVCGNNILGTFFKITLPVMRPLILSAFMLVFVIGMITLEVPIIIGMPGGIFVFTTAIFQLIATDYQSLIYYNTAAALAMMVFPITLLILFLYRWSLKGAEKFVTIAGEARAKSVHSLSYWRYVALAVFSIYFFAVMILPALVIVLISFSEFISSPSLDLLTHLTLRHWAKAFSDPVFWRALRNTLILSFAGATLSVILALALGYLIVRSGAKLKGMIEGSAMLPLAFPGTILAIGFVWVYIKTPIYGTLWILLSYFVGNYLPFALRTLSPFLFQFHKELEEASWTSGAGCLNTIVRIIIPLLKGGLFSVWILLFQIYLREFAGAIILFSFGNEVLSTLLFLRAFEEGSLGVGAVLGVLMLALSLGLHATVVKRVKVIF